MLRIVFGVIFFLIGAFGVLIGVIYPIAAVNEQGYEIGRYRVFAAGQGFSPVEVALPWREEQVRIVVEIAAPRPLPTGREDVLAMTVTNAGRTEIHQVFTLEGTQPREDGSLPLYVYALEAETVTGIREEPYTFTFEPGRVELPLAYVELVLVGGTYEIDWSVPPIGYGLMAFAGLGFWMTLRRRRPKAPPPPRWGRG